MTSLRSCSDVSTVAGDRIQVLIPASNVFWAFFPRISWPASLSQKRKCLHITVHLKSPSREENSCETGWRDSYILYRVLETGLESDQLSLSASISGKARMEWLADDLRARYP